MTLEDALQRIEEQERENEIRMDIVINKLDNILEYIGTGLQGRIDSRDDICNLINDVREYIIYSN